jgi:hypothetical protein
LVKLSGILEFCHDNTGDAPTFRSLFGPDGGASDALRRPTFVARRGIRSVRDASEGTKRARKRFYA